MDRSSASQDLYVGASIGQDYFGLNHCRLRFFGGSSNHWGGWCRALDDYDFIKKRHYPFSGWPISKSELDPYREEAGRVLDLLTPLEEKDPNKLNSVALKRIHFEASPPTRFGTKFGGELRASNNLCVYIKSNLIDLRLDDSRRSVTEAHFRSYEREEAFVVRARYFALCLGGLENPRALMNCTSQIENGIGNQESMVGRFFCEHLHYTVGEIVFERSAPVSWSFWAPTEAMIERKEILNFGLRVQPTGAWFRGGPPQGRSTRKEKYAEPPPWAGERSPTFFREMPFMEMLFARECKSAFNLRLAQAMRAESVDCSTTGSLRIASEQEATVDSRVTLSNVTDRFGWRRINLDWRLSALDFQTIRLATMTFGKLIATNHIGRLKVSDWLLDTSEKFPTTAQDEVGGCHHMCTTRMSDNSRTGVVDSNCCVHGMRNLFIGGSSVFSTTGHANPTYTIVQLALRLGDYLDTKRSEGHGF